MPRNDLIQIRQGTQSQWSSANPVLASGEPGLDITSNILKIGDGIKNWTNLLPIGGSNIVFRTGNQNISGDKTFFGNTIIATGYKIGIGINSPQYICDIYDEDLFAPFRAYDSNNNYMQIGPPEDGAGIIRINALDRIYLTTNDGNVYISGGLLINGQNLTNAALGSATNGQLYIGNGSSFVKSTLTAGTGISITNGSGSITINSLGFDNGNTVKTTGTQTINGAKTFIGPTDIYSQEPIPNYEGCDLHVNNDNILLRTYMQPLNLYGPSEDGGGPINIGDPDRSDTVINIQSDIINIGGLGTYNNYPSLSLIGYTTINSWTVDGDNLLNNNGIIDTSDINISNKLTVTGIALINNIPISVSGHKHTVSDIINFASGVSGLIPSSNISISGSGNIQVINNNNSYIIGVTGLQLNGSYVSLTGTENISGTKTFLNNINVTGQFSSVSGYFKDYLKLNGTGVSITGHTHQIYEINNLQTTLNNKQPTGLYVSLTGIETISGVKTFANAIVATGSILSPTGVFGKLISNEDFELNGSMNINLAASIIANGPITFVGNPYIVSGTGYFTKNLLVGTTGNAIPVSLSGHTHNYNQITNFCTGVAECVNTPLLAGTGIILAFASGTGLFIHFSGSQNYVSITGNESISGIKTFNQYIAATGGLTSVSGYFKDSLLLNGTGVSITGHTHQIYQIINLQSILDNKQPTGTYVSLTGIENISGSKTFTQLISATGGMSSVSGYFKDYLSLNGTGVSITGHTHQIYQVTNLQNELNNKQPTGLFVSLTGIESISGSKTFNQLISATGGLSSVSGYFKDLLQLNGTGVSLIGHTHTVSNIINFNSGVSGLLTPYQLLSNNPVTGIGISNHIAYWNNSSGITVDSGQLYWDSNNDRLGIGTQSPEYSIHIVSTGKTFGVSGSDLNYGGQPPSINLKGYTWFGNTSGSCGIGAVFNESGTFDGSSSFFGFQGFNENVTAYNPICLTTENAPQLYLNTDGNIGMGKITPSEKLDVNGSIRSCDGISDLVLGYEPSVDQYGLINRGSNAPLYITSLNTSIYQYCGGGITIDGDTGNTILQPTAGNVGIGSINNPNYTLDVNGTAGISSSLMINAATANTIASFNSSKEIVSLSTGTYPSLTELSYVKGITSSIQTQLNNKQNIVSNIITGSGTLNYYSRWISSSGIGTGIIYDNGTNISIGTILPSGKFHINSTVSNNSYILLSNPANVIKTHIGIGNSDTVPFLASTNDIQLASGTYGWGFFDRGTDGNLHIQRRGGTTTWSSVIMMDRSNGNVGIGTGIQATTPAEKLTIDGNLRLSDTAGNRIQFYRGGGSADDYTIRYGAAAGAYALQISTGNDSTTQRCVHIGSHTGGTFTGKASINGWTGNIAVGTITPNAAHRLTVVGSGTDSSGAALNATNSSSSSLLYVRNDGNVGIGTTTPSTKLQVNGLISQSTNHVVAGLTADQTITTGSDTIIQMTDKDDPNNWWNASTYRFLPTTSGYYFISAQVNWKADTGTGQINSQLRKNGTTFCLNQNPQVSGVSLTQVLTGIVNLNGSTDYVDLTGYTSATDGSQLVTGTADQAWTKLEAYKIS